MGPARERENPFQPGAGARPPVLAGRDAELALAAEMLGSLARGRRPPQGLLFFGPRGNGKTALLARIAEEAHNRGLRAESLRASALRSIEALRRQLWENIGGTTRVTGVQTAGFGVSVEPRSARENATQLLAGWIGAEATPLLILLDEASTIEPEAGRVFFEAVQAATLRDLPFLLIAAGTPDAPRRLRQAGTFTERMFEQVPVGRLERGATVRALCEPAGESGLPLADDAATLLADESQDYPYFIQLLGSAAWKAADDAGAREITEPSVRRGIAATRARIQQLYAERLDEASTRAIEAALLPLARLLRDQGGRLGPLEIRPLLAEIVAEHSLSGDETWLHETLSDLGVLWRTAAGWEMGIPSFNDYLLTLDAVETDGP